MLTSRSEVVTPGRVVDEVGVHPASRGGELDASLLRQPPIASFTHGLAAQSR